MSNVLNDNGNDPGMNSFPFFLCLESLNEGNGIGIRDLIFVVIMGQIEK